MHHWQNATRRFLAAPALATAGLLALCLSSPGSLLAQGDLEMPAFDGSVLGDAPSGASSGPVYSGSGGQVYSTDEYYPGPTGGAYASQGVAYSELLGAHLRARYNTRSYGQTRGNLNLGSMKLYDQGDSAWFIDGQVVLNDDNQFGYNAGVGYRFLTLPLLPFTGDDEKLAGISVWSDGQFTVNDNFIPQVGVSLEYLGDIWDVRQNTYVPLTDREIGEFVQSGEIAFSSNFLVQETIAGVDDPLTVTEIELARRIGDLEAWGFVGGYGLFGDTADTGGYKIGVRGFATPDVHVQFAITDDDEFGTNAVFSGTWFIGRTRANTPCRTPVAMRMRDPVLRNDYVAIRQSTVSSGAPIEGDVNGDGIDEAIRIVHVDSTAAPGGDGTFENPLDELGDVQANSFGGDVVLVHGGSAFGADAAVLQGNQRLLGEGGGVMHTVATTRFGNLVIPETAAGAQAGAIPTVTGAPGSAVTLANRTSEVSNLAFAGGVTAIDGSAGNVGVNLNNLTIDGTTGDAIILADGADTTAGMRAFAPTISTVTFANVAGDDIRLDADSTDPVTGGVTIADVTSTGGAGMGINLQNLPGTVATTITDYSHDGGGAAAGGILINETDGAVAVTNATIANEGGFGVSIVNSDAPSPAGHVFDNVNITDTTGAAFSVDGGTTGVAYTGLITQSQTGTTFLATGGHTGTVTFAEETAGTGVINATNGDGLQFVNADGDYQFNSAVVLNGDRAAIDITTGSDGTITLLDGTITNPNDSAVFVDGGAAGLTFAGTITQNNDEFAVIVQNDHTGALIFNELAAGGGGITATNGGGISFDNANGAYTFNSAVELNGDVLDEDTRLQIRSSDGQFVFDNATITSPSDIAVEVFDSGPNMVLTYTGTVTQNENFAALSVTGAGEPGDEGTITFVPNADGDPNIVATNGPGAVFNNADGDYTVLGEANFTGGAAIDIVNDSDGDINFANATITDPVGTALNINGGSSDVTFAGTITQSNNALAVSVVDHGDDPTDVDEGSLVINAATAGGTSINATNGDGLRFSNAVGDNYTINGAVMLDGFANGADTGIDILNGSTGAFTFSDTTINSPTGVGLDVQGGSSNVDFTGSIDQVNNASAVSVTGNHTGTMNFNESTAGAGVIDATNGDGLQFVNADGAYNFNDGVTLNGGDAGIDILGSSTGTFTFANTDITNPTGNAFEVAGGSADVNFTGSIEKTSAGSAVLVRNGHSGTIMFDEGTAGAGVVEATAGNGLQFNDADGNYFFNNAVALNGGDAGIDIINGSSGVFTFDAGSTITNPTGRALVVSDSAAVVNYAGTISDNADLSVEITANTGGSVTIGGQVTGSGLGILVQNNADGAFNFNGGVDLDTGANDAFRINQNTDSTVSITGGTIDTTSGDGLLVTNNTRGSVTANGLTINSTTGNATDANANTDTSFTFNNLSSTSTSGDAVRLDTNTGATVAFSGLTATATTGRGFVANDTDGLSATGGGNTITTTTGDGLTLTDVTVAGAGASFASVSVDGAARGIAMNNVTGSAVIIGAGGANTGDGGSLQNTTGAAVTLIDVQTVSLNFLDIDNAGDDGIRITESDAVTSNITIADSSITGAAGQGIDAVNSALAEFNLVVNDNTVQGAGDESIRINASGAADTSNVTISANTVSNTAEEALLVTAGVGTLNLLVEDNVNFTINDPAVSAAVISAAGTSLINATVRNNTFSNGDAVSGQPFNMSTDAAGARARLSIVNNIGTTPSGAFEFVLDNNAGTFSVENSANLDAINNGGVFDLNGVINDDPGPIPTP